MSSPEPIAPQIRYQLGSTERVLAALLFDRRYRLLAILGFVLIVTGVLANHAVGLVFLAFGGFLLLSFLWLPFVVRRRAPMMLVTTAADGLLIERDGVRALVPWRIVRRQRLVVRFLVLELAPGGRLVIPLRALSGAQVEGLRDRAAAGRSASAEPEPGPPEHIIGMTRMTVTVRPRLRDAVVALGTHPSSLVFVVLGAVMVAAGAAFPQGESRELSTSAVVLVASGMMLVAWPVWWPLVRAWLGGGIGRMIDPLEVDIGDLGYRARAAGAEASYAWASFESVRRVGAVLLLRVKGRTGEIVFSTRGMTAEQSSELEAILRGVGLEPR